MKIAIHHRKDSFSSKWIDYCQANQIDYKIVDCYSTDIIEQMEDCDALMWHFHHTNPKDTLFAKELLYSLQMAGKVVYPDFNTGWHFDDKVGQKYLLEAIDAPLVPSYVFYSKSDAMKWINETEFPKVFKLRRGSASNHVKLVKNKSAARKLVQRAFGRGFNQYNAILNLKERWRKYRAGKMKFREVLKGIVRLGYTTEFNKVAGKERGYVYFQDFIPNNEFDLRIHIISNKCFALVRMVRPGDFRASGSGMIGYDLKKVHIKAIKAAFSTAKKLKLQTVAFDFVMHNDEPYLLEMSYCFGTSPNDFDFGYWNNDLEFIEGPFNPFGWMVDSVINRIRTWDTVPN